VSIRKKSLCCTLLASLLAPPAALAAPPLTLNQAVTEALEHHPRLRALEAKRLRLAGELAAAQGWLPDNPELAGDWTSRNDPDDTTTDWELSLRQRFEIGGQRSQRVAGAVQRVAALDRDLAALRVEVGAAVRAAYARLAVAEGRAAVATEMVGLNERLAAIARARFAAGDVADADVALASLARAEAMRRRLEEARASAAARQELTLAVGVNPLPPIAPTPLTPPPPPPPLAELQAQIDHHPGLAALDHQRQAAEADLARAQAARLPDLTVSGHAGAEASRDTLAGIGLSLPLPFVHRQQGEIGAARAETARLAAAADQLRAELRQELERAHATLATALEELALFESEILPGLDTHLARIHRAYELGEMDLTTLTVTQAQVVAARFDHLQALGAAWQARIDLDRATGADFLATPGPNGKAAAQRNGEPEESERNNP